MDPLNEQPREVGGSAVQKSGWGKSYQLGKNKRSCID